MQQTRMPKRHGEAPQRGGDTDKTYLTDDSSREKDGLLPYVTTKPERKKRYRDKGHDRIMPNQPHDVRDVSPVSFGKASADEVAEEPDEKRRWTTERSRSRSSVEDDTTAPGEVASSSVDELHV